MIVGSPGAALTGAISLHPLQTRSGSPTSPTNGRAKAAYRMKRRLADGRDVISPLLSNIYLHFLDTVWQRQPSLPTLVRHRP